MGRVSEIVNIQAVLQVLLFTTFKSDTGLKKGGVTSSKVKVSTPGTHLD